MTNDQLKKARFYALKVIDFRPRSIEELTTKLKEKGFSEEIIAQVLGEFKKKGLVDDKKFSRLWISSRMAAKPKSVTLLSRELKEKGIKQEDIDDVIVETKKDYDEYEIVKRLAKDRMERLQDVDKTTAKRRLVGFLQRRGFSFETIMKVVEEQFKSLKV